MDTVLIAGIESVVGANLAAGFADHFSVVGLSFEGPISIAGCSTSVCPNEESGTIHNWLTTVRPSWIVYCGEAAHSAWGRSRAVDAASQAAGAAGNWASAAREFESRFTLISSDAVFTGPWMFHKEDSPCLCDSLEARTVRAIEEETIQHCPGALVVRTNAYGWSPPSDKPGWIEQIISDLEQRTAGPFDSQRHATPILATDLAEILKKAYEAKLEGVYHIAGVERVNPVRFVEHLAERFGLPAPLRLTVDSLAERPTGFGRGETSLHVNKLRQALDVSLPMLDDGLARLHEQQQDGDCDRFEVKEQPVKDKVA